MSINSTNYVMGKSIEYPMLRPVCIVLKELLKLHDLNKPFTGGISSFVVIIMILAFLKLSPVHTSPSKCLMALLCYYGSVFDYKTMIIANEEISFVYGSANDKLTIFHPLQPEINIAYNVTRFEEIRKCFMEGYRKIVRNEEEIKLDELLAID